MNSSLECIERGYISIRWSMKQLHSKYRKYKWQLQLLSWHFYKYQGMVTCQESNWTDSQIW